MEEANSVEVGRARGGVSAWLDLNVITGSCGPPL